MSEEYVKNQLNYPSTADFPWLDWAYGRDHDLYVLSSRVTAKNAFGVEDELPFTFRYQITDNSAEVVYFELGGNIIVNNLDSIATPDRREIVNADSADTTTQ